MELPKKIEPRPDGIITGVECAINEILDYLEAKEKEEHLRQIRMTEVSGGSELLRTATTVPSLLHEPVVTNFHSETEEMMFKEYDIEIIDDFPYLFIKIDKGFKTLAEATVTREALLKLKK